MTSMGDPRVWPSPTSAEPFATLHWLAEESLAAATAAEAIRHDAAIGSLLRAALDNRDGAALAAIFESAPSSPIYRHLWRELSRAEAVSDAGAMAVTVFALPLTILAGRENDDGASVTLPCVLRNASEITRLLREHGALEGNEAFVLANTLVSTDAIDIRNLPSIHAWRELSNDSIVRMKEPRAFAPAPIVVGVQDPRVHLRFIVGAAIAARGADLVAGNGIGRWAMPLTRFLGRALAHEGVTLLILPQAPKRLCAAVQQGRAAQREVSAQLFASNALRKFRASVGEPVAVISAHRAPDAMSGGELRVSLSSPLDPGQAEGYRCPLYRADQPSDVAEMLVTLLRDCRVGDIRVLPGVHADRDPMTGLRLLFKADALDASSRTTVQ